MAGNARWNAPSGARPGRARASRLRGRRLPVGRSAAQSASADRNRAGSRCTPCSAEDSEGGKGSRGARMTQPERPDNTAPPQACGTLAREGASLDKTTSLPMIRPTRRRDNHLTADISCWLDNNDQSSSFLWSGDVSNMSNIRPELVSTGSERRRRSRRT
jgi:hypothetical protein